MWEKAPPRLRFLLRLAAPLLLFGCAAPGLTPATGAFNAITVVCELCPPRAQENLATALEALRLDVFPPEPSFRLDLVGAPGRGAPRREKNVVVLARSDASGPCGRALTQALSPGEARRFRQSGGGCFILRDVWAEGQEVSLLWARGEAELEALLLDAGPRLRRQFEASTLARATTAAFAGGPLVTHFVYDPSRHRLYGVQGQLFAPGDSKRTFLFELEALLLTFRLEEIS